MRTKEELGNRISLDCQLPTPYLNGPPKTFARLTSHLLLLAISAFLCSCYSLYDWAAVKLHTSVVNGARTVTIDSAARPQPGEKLLTFLVVGDAGTGGIGQRAVAEGLELVSANDPAGFVLYLGDNFYESGVASVTDDLWKENFEEMYAAPSLQIPFYPALGNHDHRGNPQAQVEYSAKSTRWRMPDRYYAMTVVVDDSTDLGLFCLDTTPLDNLSADTVLGSPEAQQIRWLDSSLNVSTADWKVVFGHHNLYSGGEHGDNTHLTALLEPIFVRNGVNAYFSGHDHHQELLKPVKGVRYVISGAGGKHRDVTWRENTEFAMTNLGFTRCRLSAQRMIVEFYDREGTLLYAASLPRQSR